MPNMCNNYDYRWKFVKKHIAHKWGELTLLWYCGIKNRNNAIRNNIFSWKNNVSSDKIVKSLYSDNYKINSFSKDKTLLNQ